MSSEGKYLNPEYQNFFEKKIFSKFFFLKNELCNIAQSLDWFKQNWKKPFLSNCGDLSILQKIFLLQISIVFWEGQKRKGLFEAFPGVLFSKKTPYRSVTKKIRSMKFSNFCFKRRIKGQNVVLTPI